MKVSDLVKQVRKTPQSREWLDVQFGASDEMCRVRDDPRTEELIDRLLKRGASKSSVLDLLLDAGNLAAAARSNVMRDDAKKAGTPVELADVVKVLVARLQGLPAVGYLSSIDAGLLQKASRHDPSYSRRMSAFLSVSYLPNLLDDLKTDGSIYAGRGRLAVGRPRQNRTEYEAPDLLELLSGLEDYLRQHGSDLAVDPADYLPHPRVSTEGPKRLRTAQTAIRTHLVRLVHKRIKSLGGGRRSAPNAETALLANIILGLHHRRVLTANFVTQLHRRERRRYTIEK